MALALTATSCVRDEVVVVPALPSPSDVIAFGANLPDEATRGAEGGKTLDFSTFDASSEDSSFSLPMAIKVEEGISKHVADTRGAVVDSRDKLTSLKAWARLSSAGVAPELYIPGTAFEKNTTTGIFFPTGGESYLWPGEGKTLDFVTVSPANIEGFEPIFDAADATRVTEFHYTVPADVANQPDILVATTSKSGNFGESVPLDFKHIMAAVNFKVGTINSTVDCTIQSITMKGVYDHVRGLSPYPAAWTELCVPEGARQVLKIYETEKQFVAHTLPVGMIDTDGKTYFRIAIKDGYVNLLSIQLAGKKRMSDILHYCLTMLY